MSQLLGRDDEERFERVNSRLHQLVKKTLDGFPNVRRWEDTGDVLSAASIRLMNRLRKCNVADDREFVRLAAATIRRTLIDLARKHSGSMSFAANHDSLAGWNTGYLERAVMSDTNPTSIDDWTDFHLAVEQLPSNQKDVFDCIWYHDKSPKEVAAILHLTESAIHKRWRRARLKVAELLDQRAPA